MFGCACHLLHVGFLLSSSFGPEGGDTFVWNLGWPSTDHMAFYPRRHISWRVLHTYMRRKRAKLAFHYIKEGMEFWRNPGTMKSASVFPGVQPGVYWTGNCGDELARKNDRSAWGVPPHSGEQHRGRSDTGEHRATHLLSKWQWVTWRPSNIWDRQIIITPILTRD